MTLHHLTHSQRDAPEAHIVSNHQERSPRRTLSWRRRDKNNNQLPAHRVMTMLSSGNVPNDGNINFEDNQKSQQAHNSSIMRSNSHHGTMTGCNPNDSSKTYDHSISNNRRSFTGHIATSSSTVLATMLSFTKPNFTMRRNNQVGKVFSHYHKTKANVYRTWLVIPLQLSPETLYAGKEA